MVQMISLRAWIVTAEIELKPSRHLHDADGLRVSELSVPDGNTSPARLADVGITRKQPSEYQELADVEESVILDAIAAAGAGVGPPRLCVTLIGA